MKKVLLTILLAALLLFSACEKAPEYTHEVVSQPPELVVTVTEGSVTEHYTCNWSYLDENGQESTLGVTPGMREDWWNQTPQLVTADQTAQLTFAQPPDEMAVSRYSVTDGSSTFCELTEEGELPLTPGSWTYVFMAQWTDETRPYHGWAKYTVCIGKN